MCYNIVFIFIKYQNIVIINKNLVPINLRVLNVTNFYIIKNFVNTHYKIIYYIICNILHMKNFKRISFSLRLAKIFCSNFSKSDFIKRSIALRIVIIALNFSTINSRISPPVNVILWSRQPPRRTSEASSAPRLAMK